MVSVSLEVSLSPAWEEKLRRLVSGIAQEPDILRGQNARAVVALVLYEAEIQAVSLSPPLGNESAQEQNPQSERIRQWTLDRSSPAYLSWDDGLSLTVPPRTYRPE